MPNFDFLFVAPFKLSRETGNTEYRFLEHMTDAEIEAYGSSLEEAFENAAKALEDTMVDIKTISPLIAENIKVDGDNKEQLLYNWLEALIIKQDTDSMLYSKFDCKISKDPKGKFNLVAKVNGEKFDPKKHEQKTAVKAPTYHEMSIRENKLTKNNSKRQVTLRFLLDL